MIHKDVPIFDVSNKLDLLYVVFVTLLVSGLVVQGTLQIAIIMLALTVLVAVMLGNVAISLLYIMYYRVP
jgi:hypothetical protein